MRRLLRGCTTPWFVLPRQLHHGGREDKLGGRLHHDCILHYDRKSWRAMRKYQDTTS